MRFTRSAVAAGGFVAGQPTPAMQEDLDPEDFRAFINGAAASQVIRWWKSSLNPNYTLISADFDPTTGQQKWNYQEQCNIAQYRALIRDGQWMKRYGQEGSLQVGDMTIMTMPDELPVGDHDLVVAYGRAFTMQGLPLNARTLLNKEACTRGRLEIQQNGTVTSTGASVTGVGTTFTQLGVGALVRAAGQALRITTIASDTSMTVESPPAPIWNSNNYVSLVDQLLYWPVAEIEEIQVAAGALIPGVDYTLNTDEKTINWLSLNAPAAGIGFSVVYRYYPKYQVIGDLGLSNHSIRGIPLPQTCVMRLYKPDSLQE
jgi:hypothetical protein